MTVTNLHILFFIVFADSIFFTTFNLFNPELCVIYIS